MKPLEILHTDFHRGWGGQASRVLMLSKELARRGHRVVIAVPPGELARRARLEGAGTGGVTVRDGFAFRAPGHAVSFARDLKRMAALLRRETFDLVHVHGSQDTWVAALARAIAGRPRCLVMTRHNTKRVRTGRANRILYGRLVDHLILADESVRSRYRAFLEDGTLDEARISVVPSAYRADLFHEGVEGGGVRRELGIPDGALVVGVAGRLAADKGHTYLLKAAAALKPHLPGLTLLFAGAGPAGGRLREEARALGLDGTVRFLGFRPDSAQVQAAFDIAVLPSVGCDASSAAIKEAMALGVPVVASDIGGAHGILEPGVTGILVRPGRADDLVAALRGLAGDAAGARAMARRARREVARRFSIERLADQTLEAYARALSMGGARRGLRRRASVLRAGRTA
ncbi:MAG: glycosyltransferase family 4 protein [Planctomycetota bacterium]